MLPGAILLFVVYVLPMCMSVFYGMTRYSLLSPPQWIGFANYGALLHDPLFWSSAVRTLYFVSVIVISGTILSLLVAMLMNQTLIGAALYRTIIYFPQTISFASGALIWTWLFDPTYGPIDQTLAGLGLPVVNWLTDPRLALPSIVIASLWRDIGYYMLIFLAALQNVPRPLKEAAQIDGANSWRVFFHITLPTIQPAILFVVLTWTIGALQFFTQPYVMTNGGPAYATMSVVLKIYRDGFENLNMGYASAESMVLFVVTLLLSILFIRIFRRSVE